MRVDEAIAILKQDSVEDCPCYWCEATRLVVAEIERLRMEIDSVRGHHEADNREWRKEQASTPILTQEESQ